MVLKTRKKVLITGASGFIGRHVIDPLVKRGYEIHGTYHMQQSDQHFERSTLCTWHQADLLAQGVAAELIGKIQPTHLLHLAWYTEHGKYWTSPENLSWVTASLRLLEEFAKSEGTRVVVAGTCAEYDWRYGFCNEEITPLKPWSLYGASKHSLQIISSAFALESALSIAWGRIFFPFGPGESRERLVSSAIQSFLKGEPARCTHGEQIRDYMYVEDVADAFAALLDSNYRGTVNIASGVAVTVKDLIWQIARCCGGEDLVQLGVLSASPEEARMVVADTTTLNNRIEWMPSYTLESAIKKTVAWWKTRELETAGAVSRIIST